MLRSNHPPSAGCSEQPPQAVALELLVIVALYALPVAIMLRPVTDQDIWWHLRTGQWICDHGAVPATDPFSAFGHGKPWVAYSWLCDVLVFGLYRALGLYGVLLYRVVLGLAALVAYHRLVSRREPNFVVASVLVALSFFACSAFLVERPWLFSIFFCAVTLETILAFREGTATRWVWLLPVLFAFWANVHLQFGYGLFLLALACTAPCWIALLGSRLPAGKHFASFRKPGGNWLV